MTGSDDTFTISDPPVPEPEELGAPIRYEPVRLGERIVELDVLRGFALLGIAMVNIAFFAYPLDFVIDPEWTRPLDRVAHNFVELFATGKFYPLFSLLFGVGFGVQLDRMWRRKVAAGGWFARRMAVLLLFGIGHITLLWYGDILSTYAVIGLCLLWFRYNEPRALLRASLIASLAPIGFVVLMWMFVVMASSLPGVEAEMATHAAADRARVSSEMERASEAYRGGSWGTVFAQRVHDFSRTFFLGLPAWPLILSMFLLGFWFARTGRLFTLESQGSWLRSIFVIGLVTGLPANIAYLILSLGSDPHVMTLSMTVMLVLHFAGGALLMLAYASGIVLLMRGRFRSLLTRLAPLGRMALTNYLLQSMVFVLIFHGYALGWFGRVGAAGLLLIAILTWLVQIPLSAAWLSRFRYGPAEWLWRRLSYGRIEPSS